MTQLPTQVLDVPTMPRPTVCVMAPTLSSLRPVVARRSDAVVGFSSRGTKSSLAPLPVYR